jgi:hypothetical protein
MSSHHEKYNDLSWVLSALHSMIDETIYHMKTFAHTLEVHHNNEVAKIFSFAHAQFQKEESILFSHSKNKTLPTLPPWEMPYPNYQHPSELLSEIDYLISPIEAWQTVHHVVEIHQDFYKFLVKESSTSEVLMLTQELLVYCQTCGVNNQTTVSNLPLHHTQREDDLDLI